jgi:DNA-binding MarR family transcriptional regulator
MTRTAKSHLDELTPRARLDEGAIHDLLGYQLAQATIITSASFEQEVGRPFELRPVEFTLLQLIMENTDVSPTRLAHALAVKTSGITVWIDRLAARNLVMRERSATDGRARHLRVTAEGKSLVKKAVHGLLQADHKLLQHLSPGEQKILIELLRKVARVRPIPG